MERHVNNFGCEGVKLSKVMRICD